jgi:hypothetical protein
MYVLDRAFIELISEHLGCGGEWTAFQHLHDLFHLARVQTSLHIFIATGYSARKCESR